MLTVLCALTTALCAETVRPNETKGAETLRFTDVDQTSPLNVECHVGSVCILHNAGLAKLDKVSPDRAVIQS